MIEAYFVWKCDHCDNAHVEQQGTGPHGLTIGSHITTQDLPTRWSLVDRKLVCPLHHIKVTTLEHRDMLEMARDVYRGQFRRTHSTA